MNYKEFQEKQANKVTSPLEKPIKKPFNWGRLSMLSGLMSIIAIISMILFFKNYPVIPGVICLITAILYYIQWKNGECKIFLPAIWTINSIIWFLNPLIK